MEEIKAYIESGILELYVMGEVSHNEKLEVEAMALKHPAIMAELSEIERAMEGYANENQIEPSAGLRNRVLNSLLTNLGDDRIFEKNTAPLTETKVVQMPVAKTVNFYKYAFAACLALLLVSLVALLNVYNKLQSSNEQIAALTTQRNQFAKTVSFQNEQLSVFRDTSFKVINLPGTAKAPKASMSMAWSPTNKKVMIDMADMNMPVNDQAHQYQLWAIVNGKPVDLGVFDAKADSATVMKEMKSVSSPQAFAVTLEPRGGSINPTMDKMMVLAKI